MAEFIECPSPNHDDRKGRAVDILLLHYTGMESGAAALARLCDKAAKVSAHYLIEEDGRIFRLVPEERRAWHAGISCWAGARDINARAIGIELVNPGHEFGYRDFPAAQIAGLTALALEILDRHAIPPARVLGHADVAPARKQDPGERLDWAGLAAAGIGLWPGEGALHPPDEAVARGALGRFGYGLEDASFAEVITAFQRHFRPRQVTGQLDPETMGRLLALVSARG